MKALKMHRLAAGARRSPGEGLYSRPFSRLNLAQMASFRFRDAVDVGVLGLAVHDRPDGGLLDVVGRVEVGLAGTEAG